MNLTKLTRVLVLALVSQAVFSGSQGNVSPLSQYQPLITVTLGPDFVTAGRSQSRTLLPPFQNHYTANNKWQTVVDVGGFIGVERTVSECVIAQLGASVYYDSNINPQGHVWQFALPQFDNLAYKYRIQSTRLMLAGKLLTTPSSVTALHPYFSWEIGSAFNHASAYRETSLIPTVLPMAPFGNQNQSSFTYGVGLGLDYAISEHTRVGMGYQFADLGSASLGATSAAITHETLSVSHLYTNQLRFQFTYLV